MAAMYSCAGCSQTRAQEGLKSSLSGSCQAVSWGGDCTCQEGRLSAIDKNVLQWQPCVKIIFKPFLWRDKSVLRLSGATISSHFGERDKRASCLPHQRDSQATVTRFTLLTLRLVWEVTEGRTLWKEFCGHYQMIFSDGATGAKSMLETFCIRSILSGGQRRRTMVESFPSTSILNKNRKLNIFILFFFFPATLFTAKNTSQSQGNHCALWVLSPSCFQDNVNLQGCF